MSPTGDQDASEPEEESGSNTESTVCPVCGAPLLHEKCKLVCRSERCVYRIVFNCAEF